MTQQAMTPAHLAENLVRLVRSAAPLETIEHVARLYAGDDVDDQTAADLAYYVADLEAEVRSIAPRLERCQAVGSPHAADWLRLADAIDHEAHEARSTLTDLLAAAIEEAQQ